MGEDRQKLKNVKDLEYSRLLNNQNIILVLIGTFMISVFLIDKLPSNISRTDILLFLISSGIGFLIYYSKKLDEKLEEIKNL